jgi:UDP-N-acetylglucosamine/UDP-N-acetylgalactosamine diphosphorylase
LDGGKIRVLEYSEISQELREKRDPDNLQKLLLRAGSIANHVFTRNFLKIACQYSAMPFHIAHKRIPYLDPASGKIVHPDLPNGIKLERFIFDVFCLARFSNSLFKFNKFKF